MELRIDQAGWARSDVSVSSPGGKRKWRQVRRKISHHLSRGDSRCFPARARPREADARGEKLGVNDEVAVYDARGVRDSAGQALGDETLRMVARERVEPG